jgi:hypothetical protein
MNDRGGTKWVNDTVGESCISANVGGKDCGHYSQSSVPARFPWVTNRQELRQFNRCHSRQHSNGSFHHPFSG